MSTPHTTTLPQLLTPNQTAEYLQRSAKSLERDRLNGNGIQFIRVGRLIRYRVSDVAAYLDQNTLLSTSQQKEKL